MSRLLLAALSLTLGACVPSLHLTPSYGSFDVSGDLSGVDTSNPMVAVSTSTSLEALGLNESDDTFNPRVVLEAGAMQISISALNAGFNGTGDLDADLTGDSPIDGSQTTITAGTAVTTLFDFEALSGTITWDFIPTDFVEFGLGIGVTMLDLNFILAESIPADPNNPLSVEGDETFPIPLIAARAGFEVGPVDVDAVLGVIDVSIDDGEAAIIDGDIAARYHLFGGDERFAAYLVAGYRFFDVDAEYTDDDTEVEVNFTIDGPYIGARISF